MSNFNRFQCFSMFLHYVVPLSLRSAQIVLSKNAYHEVGIFRPGTFLTIFLRHLRRLEGASQRLKGRKQLIFKKISEFLTLIALIQSFDQKYMIVLQDFMVMETNSIYQGGL